MSDYQDEDDEVTQYQQVALRSAKASTPIDKFNVGADRIFLSGTEQYGDFENTVEALKAAGVMSDDVILQAMECDNPPAILDALGRDIDVAKQVAALPPVKRAAALAAISAGQPVPSFNAVPGWQRPRNDLSREDLSDAAWSKQFDRVYKNGLPGFGGRRGR